MLIRDDGDSWTAIGQPAHAWLAAQVARVWDPAPDPAVLLGVEQHDAAWTEWDRRPALNAAAGRAASFVEVDALPRLVMWRGAAERVVAQNPYAALLVSLHATNIHTRFGDPDSLDDAERTALDGLLAEQAATQRTLLDRLDVGREHAERDGDFVFCLDAISLILCHGGAERDLPPVDGRTLRLEWLGEAEATLRPWPLAVDALEVGLHARRLTRRFEDEAALHTALDEAPWSTLGWRLRRA